MIPWASSTPAAACHGLALRPQLLIQTPLGLLQPRRPGRWDRPLLLGAPLVQPALSSAQPAAPALRRRQPPRQLVTATTAEPLVRFGVDAIRVFEDLASDLLGSHGWRAGRRSREPSCRRPRSARRR